jgi:hypothetical protein
MTLSGCLLSGCGLGSLTPQQAAELWSQWQQASQAHAVGTGERLDALLGLAPEWQPLPGLKRLTKKQQAGINRLRGLVQLAAAAATLQQPVGEVMQVRGPGRAAACTRGSCVRCNRCTSGS